MIGGKGKRKGKKEEVEEDDTSMVPLSEFSDNFASEPSQENVEEEAQEAVSNEQEKSEEQEEEEEDMDQNENEKEKGVGGGGGEESDALGSIDSDCDSYSYKFATKKQTLTGWSVFFRALAWLLLLAFGLFFVFGPYTKQTRAVGFIFGSHFLSPAGHALLGWLSIYLALIGLCHSFAWCTVINRTTTNNHTRDEDNEEWGLCALPRSSSFVGGTTSTWCGGNAGKNQNNNNKRLICSVHPLQLLWITVSVILSTALVQSVASSQPSWYVPVLYYIDQVFMGILFITLFFRIFLYFRVPFICNLVFTLLLALVFTHLHMLMWRTPAVVFTFYLTSFALFFFTFFMLALVGNVHCLYEF